jgi:hypothetical protein
MLSKVDPPVVLYGGVALRDPLRARYAAPFLAEYEGAGPHPTRFQIVDPPSSDVVTLLRPLN